LHAGTPLRYLYCDTKKNGSSVLPDVFLDILILKVGSLQWLGLKLVLSHLRGLPGAPKSAKKALSSSGING
jgi:hypothetical protein